MLVLSLAAIAAVSFILGLGGAPFNELHKLPIFSSMRVSTRFLFITSFLILIIGCYVFSQIVKKQNKTAMASNILLFIAVVEVFTVGLNLNIGLWQRPLALSPRIAEYSNRVPPRSEKRWMADTTRPYYNHAMTLATRSNHTQILADNALVNTDDIATGLCDEDERGCSFVISNNANIIYWSPNHIKLARTGEGAIILNMNSSKNWKVNNIKASPNKQIVSTTQLSIDDSSEHIYDLVYMP
jgi:hypothetical protein